MKLDAKQKKYLLIGGAVILGFYIINKWLKNMPRPINPDLEATPNLNTKIILKKGSKGAEVAELQRKLLKDYNADLGKTGIKSDGVDGDFGILTEVALKKAKGVTEIALKDL